MMKREERDMSMYEDILYLPHPSSPARPRMPVSQRAAQFAPFAALAGHGDAIRETARVTRERAQLDEEQQRMMDETLRLIMKYPEERRKVRVTYFLPDERKAGGEYMTAAGAVKRVTPDGGRLVMEDGTEVRMEDLAEIEFIG